MTTKAHKDLTGADLHEPKGVSSATAGSYYRADGLGSGVWTPLILPTGAFKVSTTTFTSTGTWTKPANCFAIKVMMVAGGGGGGGTSVGSGGTSGANTTFTGFGTVNSGTSGGSTGPGLGGATQAGQAISMSGEDGFSTSTSGISNVRGGNSPGPLGSIIDPKHAYGSGGQADLSGNSGGGGAYGELWLDASLVPSTVSVIVGAGGSKGSGSSTAGTAGVVHVEEYILV